MTPNPLVSAFDMAIRNIAMIRFFSVLVIISFLIILVFMRYTSAREVLLVLLALASVWLIVRHQKDGNNTQQNPALDFLYQYWVYAPLLLTFSLTFLALWTIPMVPARDAWSFGIDKALLVIAIVIYLLLLSTAIEATRRVYLWLQNDEQQIGPQSDATYIAKKIDEIACRTTAVQKQIFKPFVILTLMLISRNRAFDNWVVSPGLLAIFLMGFGLMAACAFFVWHPANRIRDDARKTFRKEDRGQETDRSRALESTEGAYGGILTGPLVKGMVLLAGGAGFDPLLEKLISWLGW